MKRLLTIPLILGLCVLGACGGDDGNGNGNGNGNGGGGDGGGGSSAPSACGTWQVDAESLKAQVLQLAMKQAGLTESDPTYAAKKAAMEQAADMQTKMFANMKCGFNEDGTCWMEAMGKKMEGKYTMTGNTINVTPDKEEDGPVPPLVLDGDTIKGTMPTPGGEINMVFKKT